MKLIALRAAQFRRFSDGVAVEGFDGGVNLLAGPNELGKSTLFQALEAAFLMRHGTSGAALDAMRPRRGGEPVVEADFETQGRRYRIRKQFGRGKTALLSDLDSGRTIARAGDAEEHLAVLTGAGSDGPGRVGLMWVRQQRALQAPDPDIEPLSNKAKSRGEANALMSLLCDEIVDAAGSGAAGDIAARVAAALGQLVTGAREGPKKGGPYDLALREREVAQKDLQRAREAAEASEARQARIAKLQDELAQFEDAGQAASRASRIATLEKAIAQAASQRTRAGLARAEHTARRLEADSASARIKEIEADSGRRRDLAEALDAARRLQQRSKELATAINANTATPVRLNALDHCEAFVRRDEQAIAKLSTAVEILPDDGKQHLFSADGAAIAPGAEISVPERITISIAGAGRVIVTSSDGARAANLNRSLSEARATLSRLVAEMGARSPEDARARAGARAAASAELDALRLDLAAIAPHGVAGLEKELGALDARGANSDLEAAKQVHAGLAVAELAARQELEQVLAGSVDDARFIAMTRDLEALKHESARCEADARRWSEQIERLKGEQAGSDEDGRAGQVAAAQDALARADEQVRYCEDEIAALRLLSATLARSVEGVRTRYLEPVSRALAPYLAQVFPEAALAFREGFSLDAVTRAGEREEFASLSDGTREQLAILVRMGFARLFAERGLPVPLVLDDPLVYSDDQRLAAMCRAIETAAQTSQIVILTCREAAFAHLAAHRLAVTPWQGV